MQVDTTERWVRSRKKRFVPNVWHLVDGVEDYDADLLVLRCAKRARVDLVEQAPAPSTVGLMCALCERHRFAKTRPGHRPAPGIGRVPERSVKVPTSPSIKGEGGGISRTLA